MIRAREGLVPLIAGSGLAIRVIVKWKCRAPLDFGLPSPADYEELEAFEDSLVSALEGGAVLAFVFTHAGVVTYNFYTGDSSWFVERLNEALRDQAVVPIDLTSEHDPDWSEYRSLLRGAGLDDSAV